MDASGVVPVLDEAFYRGILDGLNDGVYFVDRQRRITYWNAGAERLTGFTAEQVLGHSCSEGILRHVNDGGRQLCVHGCPLAGVMRDGRSRSAQVYLHHKEGHRVPVTVRGQAVHDQAGEVVGSVEVFSGRAVNPFAGASDRSTDIDPMADPVTGIGNRRFGESQAFALVSLAEQGTASLGVLFVDVDHFKAVNDRFGHRMGDSVLRMVAQTLSNGLRGGDIPSRWGGEEFVLLCPGMVAGALPAVAERLRMLVENSWIGLDEGNVMVTVSIGATMWRPGDDVGSLLDRADRHMYASKAGGRNRVTTDVDAEVGSEVPSRG